MLCKEPPALRAQIIGNQVKILSDPVTVSGEPAGVPLCRILPGIYLETMLRDLPREETHEKVRSDVRAASQETC